MSICPTCIHWHKIKKHSSGRVHGECSAKIPFWATASVQSSPAPWIIWEDEEQSESCDCYIQKPEGGTP